MKSNLNKKLKEIEESLMSHEKSFGFICVMGYYDSDEKADIDEYFLCTAVAYSNYSAGLLVGSDVWLSKDKEVIITAEDLLAIFDVFKRCKKELICDLSKDIATFDINKYIDRIRLLSP